MTEKLSSKKESHENNHMNIQVICPPDNTSSSTRDEMEKLIKEIKKLKEEIKELKTEKKDNNNISSKSSKCELPKNVLKLKNKLSFIDNSTNPYNSYNIITSEKMTLPPLRNFNYPYNPHSFKINPFNNTYNPFNPFPIFNRTPLLALPDPNNYNEEKYDLNQNETKNIKDENINNLLYPIINNYPFKPNGYNYLFNNQNFNLPNNFEIQEDNREFSDSDDEDDFIPKKKKIKKNNKEKIRKKEKPQKFYCKTNYKGQKKIHKYPKKNH